MKFAKSTASTAASAPPKHRKQTMQITNCRKKHPMATKSNGILRKPTHNHTHNHTHTPIRTPAHTQIQFQI